MNGCHPILAAFDPDLEEHSDWIARRFERLNGVCPQKITYEDAKQLNCPIDDWVAAWVWDLVPSTVDRVLYLSHVIVPVLPFGEIPTTDFGAVQSVVYHERRMMRSYPILDKAGMTYDTTLFLVHRRLRPMFDKMKTFHKEMKFNIAMNLAVRTVPNKETLPRLWNWSLWGLKSTDYTSAKCLNVKAENRAVVRSLLSAFRMVLREC